MDVIQFGESRKTEGGSSVSLFLALFLLVLAFFILLVSISTIEETRSKQVMDSLTSTFSELVEPSESADPFLSQHGDFLEPEGFQAEIADVFTTAISAVKVKVIKPGQDMRVEMSTQQIFVDGIFDIRAVRTPLIDRLVSSLSRNPPNVRFQSQIMMAVPPAQIGTDSTDTVSNDDVEANDRARRIALRRADTLARYMIARGAPPETVGAGIYVSESPSLRFEFLVRRNDELVVDFGDAVEIGETDSGPAPAVDDQP